MSDGIYRNTCSRGCYGTCSMLSYVKDNKLLKVTGDPEQGFNQGRLCAKGYASTQLVYHPERLKYPMMQHPRGSGNWKRITWDQAYATIAQKMIKLQKRYDSNLSIAFDKYHGNIGILHHAVEGMFNSIGPHSKPVGSPCAKTGEVAMRESIGKMVSFDPENMRNASLIVLWGANPSTTNVHQMKFIYEARQKGAVVVCIDPIFTKTAQKADYYIQINPDTDEWLAIGIAKLLIDKGDYSKDFVRHYMSGWEQYESYINEINYDEICEKTGVSMEVLEILAQLYANCKPAVTWCGLGLQRTSNGKRIISSITTLIALTGNLLLKNGGIYYGNPNEEVFPNRLLNHTGPTHPFIKHSREIDISDFASSALSFQNPPIKFLWVAATNPLSQDHNFQAWYELINQLDMLVTADIFITKTANYSDIVLPVTTHFEEEDINVSYWHNWLSLNEKAIPPYYEAKSDLQIARGLTKKLNELSPGFSNFPADKEALHWITDELTPEILDLYSINNYQDLLNGPRKKGRNTPLLEKGEKFYCFSPKVVEEEHVGNQKSEENGYRLLTPQSLLMLHSQLGQLTWLIQNNTEDKIEVPTDIAERYMLDNDMKVEVYNEYGAITGSLKINSYLPSNVILANQGGRNPINQIITLKKLEKVNQSSSRFYDCRVKIRKWRDLNV